jgi:uncharacterized protein (UPF0261 family)
MKEGSRKNIVFVGTFDTKGAEAEYVKAFIEGQVFTVTTIDVGTGAKGRPPFSCDYPPEKVAAAAGVTIDEIRSLAQAGKSQQWTQLMGSGAATIVRRLFDEKECDGIISFGGNAGTSLASIAMKSIPFGVPKVICSTVASGNTRPYVGTKDICMVPSIADIAGLNRITKVSLTQAAAALLGMVNAGLPEGSSRPLIAVTEIGRLADSSPRIRAILEENGYETVLFHGVGTGGMAVEEMIEQGQVQGILDLSLNEVMDHIYGGFCDAGPTRLLAAAKKGIPAVIAPGYSNRIVYSSREAIPKKFEGRDIWQLGVSMFILSAAGEEMKELADVLVEKINQYTGATVLMLPLQGFSSPKDRFDNPEVNAVLFHELRQRIKPHVKIKELDMHILDPEFAEEATRTLLGLMK